MNFDSVHQFWFGDNLEKSPLKNRDLWWTRPEGIDELITQRFSSILKRAKSNQLEDWKSSPRGYISLIIVLDQFPRHIFRGKPASFESDPLALDLCLQGLAQKIDQQMHWAERQFYLLPLEHSEDLQIQIRAIEEFKRLVHDTPAEFADYMKDNFDYALRHHEIIKRFGRFPHRNKILGRESRAEEIEFLKQPGSSF